MSLKWICDKCGFQQTAVHSGGLYGNYYTPEGWYSWSQKSFCGPCWHEVATAVNRVLGTT